MTAKTEIFMKYDIMLNILNQLLAKKKITAREIAERYDVSLRSVYRYIEELTLCGVPIEIVRGRYGGIMLADTYRLPSGYFTREEYASILNALDAMASQISDLNLVSAREKLISRQKSERQELSVSGNIIIDGGSWSEAGKFSDKLHVCEKAVNECKCLLIDYISRSGEHSKRVIDPHVLVFKQNVWYVYAFCHTKQCFRTFKIGRIKQASFTGREFERKEFTKDDIDLDFNYTDKQLIDVTLDIDKNSLADAEEWLGIDNIEPKGKGFIASVRLPDDEALVGKILSYGGAVKVISPLELRERVKAAAKKIAETE